MEYLKTIGPALSKEYGFPVSFVFVNSHPGEDRYLFNKEPMEESAWLALEGQKSGQHKTGKKKFGK